MESSLVVLIPVLNRPHRVAPVYESILAATPPPVRVLFCCTDDDTAEIEAIRAIGAEHLSCGPWAPGDYARKINLGYRHTTEPLIFLGADDLSFHPGWLDAAVSHLSDTIHVVGTNDLGNPRVIAGSHSTHSLLTRQYADRYGTVDRNHQILHEGYAHTFCDDEFIATAKARLTYSFAADSIVEHLHPHWGKAAWDDVYSIADASLTSGRQLFIRRRRLWHSVTWQNQQPNRQRRYRAAR